MFKPLLAAKAELDKLTFPMIASPKIDGIRCLIDPEKGAVSRTMKPIPNRHVREMLAGVAPYLDGELVTYDDAGNVEDFNTVQSKIMREDGKPVFLFQVFDSFARPQDGYMSRKADAIRAIGESNDFAQFHSYDIVYDMDGLMEIEADHVRDGWEGTMLRKMDGEYKHGRSTAREGLLLKIKRFEDDEAEIVGTIERMHNGNEATKDAFGRTERSTHKANMVPTDTLGALSVRWKGIQFEIGTGFDDAQRAGLWAIRDSLIGQTVTFKFQGVGSLGAPRFPVFLGIRHDLKAVA